ncbi:hypothetical protein Btru_043314 [Bulinus truncatus]|nr:hypothetical protein Btru_043314 [Bulinus truncatus]
MDKVTSSFVQVWHTSSTHLADNSNGVIEGIVRASGDLKITVDFPVVRETQIVTSGMHQQDDQTKVTDSQNQPKNEKKEQNYDSAVEKILLACDHFSELTTFHGMRIVCSRGPNHIRRLIWTVMILACMVALALQVRQQVLYFLSNPKTINVEKKFVDSLDFPTVTICNENSFRISAAYEHGLYDVINELFNGTLTESEVNRTGVTNLRLDEFNYKAGNRIENMILRCKWNTLENCYSNNFTRIITDHGLCYSFNGPDSIRELTVQTPGATKNLQLTLNIEEYERMSGAQVASGIHILVHNRREFPLVKQLECHYVYPGDDPELLPYNDTSIDIECNEIGHINGGKILTEVLCCLADGNKTRDLLLPHGVYRNTYNIPLITEEYTDIPGHYQAVQTYVHQYSSLSDYVFVEGTMKQLQRANTNEKCYITPVDIVYNQEDYITPVDIVYNQEDYITPVDIVYNQEDYITPVDIVYNQEDYITPVDIVYNQEDYITPVDIVYNQENYITPVDDFYNQPKTKSSYVDKCDTSVNSLDNVSLNEYINPIDVVYI